jgi:bisphosphoglycerate-dependent phosphoglycerate mutase
MKTRRIKLKEKYSRKHRGGAALEEAAEHIEDNAANVEARRLAEAERAEAERGDGGGEGGNGPGGGKKPGDRDGKGGPGGGKKTGDGDGKGGPGGDNGDPAGKKKENLSGKGGPEDENEPDGSGDSGSGAVSVSVISEETKKTVKEIRSAIFEELNKATPAERRNITSRIITALKNTKNNESFVRNVTQKLGMESADSNETNKSYNFKRTKDKFLASLDSKIINPTQKQFINNVIKYYNSTFGITPPKLDETHKFTQSQYNHLFKKATSNTNKDIQNPEFSKILTKTLSYIQDNYSATIIRVGAEKGIFYNTPGTIKLDRSETTLSKQLKLHTELLLVLNQAFELMTDADRLKHVLITASATAGVMPPIDNYDRAQKDAAAAEETRLKGAVAAAKGALDAAPDEGKGVLQPPLDAATQALAPYTSLMAAYNAYEEKLPEITKIQKILFDKTEPPRSKYYYAQARILYSGSTPPFNLPYIRQHTSEQIENAGKEYRPLYPFIAPRGGGPPAPSDITLELVRKFKEIVEATIENTRNNLQDKKGYLGVNNNTSEGPEAAE